MRRSSASSAPRRRAPALLAWCVLLAAQDARALDVRRAEASFQDGAFHVRFEAVLDAPPAGVAAVLNDYRNFGRLDPRIHRVEVGGSDPDGTVTMRTIIDACAGFFCRTVQRVERVYSRPGSLDSEVVPDQSDMRQGSARTRWAAEGTGTRVRYEADFQPAFWVPGFIGRYYALGALEQSTRQLFERVEQYARGG
jgi:hypothetical protein